ncbi:MAG TPA: UvrD-helicase domain-containing protein, partial [Longimicrobiales bacterium]|nr:UvrD-helicase domain-containing protein [Longimicrobiales bacterium]
MSPRELKTRLLEWTGPDSDATRLVGAWLAHRYPIALGFAGRAAREFAAFRRRTGQLSFHDLLAVTAELLRDSPRARVDLGRRYTHLLVDEFQDTDPLQAEILFLLASEPDATEEERPAPDWTRVRPRPGALFVVGDPKQSIYRFRRADIALYQQVRHRFAEFGEVVRLTANFRSRPAVGALVDHVFGEKGLFPGEATEHQARFSPLESVREATPPDRTVAVHDVPPCDDSDVHWAARPSHERETEALALATWVSDRVGSAEREPGDFLVLTRGKRALDLYARALEARNLPVQVSGAGVGVEEELAELRRLLRALGDPDDRVLTVAALTGLFFGLDLDRLLGHRESVTAADEARRPFDFRSWPPTPGDRSVETGSVPAALGTMHRWWRLAQREPADVVVQTLVDELGLLPHAAAGELGQVRAGALAYALDAVRAAGLQGDTSLIGALDALETTLGDEEVEAPLEPGREDAIRVMNLHKAKGLEGTVVVLADPHSHSDRPTRLVGERDGTGRPVGWMRIGVPGPYNSFDDLAKPRVWDEKEEAERVFEEAEEARLLYVAATRAEDELLVMRVGDTRRASRSPWSPLHGWIDGHGGTLEVETRPPE